MKYVKIFSVSILGLVAILSATACAVLKPIGDITLIEAPLSYANDTSRGAANDDDTGASVKITAIITGWVEAPAYILMDQKNQRTPEAYRKPQWVPSIAYVVRHPSKGTVVFDFGLKSGDCDYGLKPLYWVPCRNEGHDTLASYLAANSSLLEEIIYLIPSHFHGDHVSGLSEVLSFTTAPLLVTQEALSEVKSFTREFVGIQANMMKADMDVILMDEGFITDPILGHVFDVFGDSSVRIFETSGHSTGHISAILRADDHNIILSFDAAHLRANYDLGIPSGSVSDKLDARESLNRLRHIQTKLDKAHIIFGHDPDQWNCHGKILEIGEEEYGEC